MVLWAMLIYINGLQFYAKNYNSYETIFREPSYLLSLRPLRSANPVEYLNKDSCPNSNNILLASPIPWMARRGLGRSSGAAVHRQSPPIVAYGRGTLPRWRSDERLS